MKELFNTISKYGWSEETLTIWSDSDFKCVYCDLDMMSTLDASQIGKLDHLLPQSKYPLLITERSNLVLSCDVCNRIKRHWDPNTRAGEPVYRDEAQLNLSQRRELLHRARDYVQSQRTAKLQELQDQQKAIESYRQRAKAI